MMAVWNISKPIAATERSLDTVACPGSNDLDDPRADCRGSDNLVASDRARDMLGGLKFCEQFSDHPRIASVHADTSPLS